jgi:hypothetical protein
MTIIFANITVLIYSRLFSHRYYNVMMQSATKLTAVLTPFGLSTPFNNHLYLFGSHDGHK